MALQRFPSKYDWWILLLVFGLPVCVFAAIFHDLSYADDLSSLKNLVLIFSSPVLYCLIVFGVAMPINYFISDGDLIIRGGLLLKIRVPISTIVLIRPTRNPLSSPAGSLDRLRIEYSSRKNRKKVVMISPAQRSQFLEAVLRRNNKLIRQGDELTLEN